VAQPASEMQIDLMEPLQSNNMGQTTRSHLSTRGPAFFATGSHRPCSGRVSTRRSRVLTRAITRSPESTRQVGSRGRGQSGSSLIVTTYQEMGRRRLGAEQDTQATNDSQRVALTCPIRYDGLPRRPAKTTHNSDSHDYDGSRQSDHNYSSRSPPEPRVKRALHETYGRSKGQAPMDFWPSTPSRESHRQWPQARSIDAVFEPGSVSTHGTRMVTSARGSQYRMEPQSAVSDGNWFQNGYLQARERRGGERIRTGPRLK